MVILPNGTALAIDDIASDDMAAEDNGDASALTGQRRRVGGIPLRAFVPNAITALALCCGLSAVRFALAQQWDLAMGAIVLAGVLDGVDGRIARLLKASSRFGAELDSLSDVIAFGVAPAMILYLWALEAAPKFGWTVALSLTVCCALRLARFNSNLDVEHQPRKAAGFNTGVPAPAGAGIALLPLVLWLTTGFDALRSWWVVMPWVVLTAIMLIASFATYSWTSFRLRREWRLFALAGVGLLGAALVTSPWPTLAVITIVYMLTLPFGLAGYARIKRQRQAAAPNG